MLNCSWMIVSAPKIEWYLPETVADWPDFRHLRSSVVSEATKSTYRRGDTLWGARLVDDTVLYLAWEWVEIRDGVISLVDPNAILSNACFIDEQGEPLSHLISTICTMRLVHGMNWAEWVTATLRGAKTQGALPLPSARSQEPAALPRVAGGTRYLANQRMA